MLGQKPSCFRLCGSHGGKGAREDFPMGCSALDSHLQSGGGTGLAGPCSQPVWEGNTSAHGVSGGRRRGRSEADVLFWSLWLVPCS